jgi:hypothetical protein
MEPEDERRESRRASGFERADESLCAADYSALRGIAQDDGSPGAWQTGVAFRHIGWGALPRGTTSPLKCRFHQQNRGGLQEFEETAYWLELLCDSTIVAQERLMPLQDETEELTAIFVTMVKKVKSKGKP